MCSAARAANKVGGAEIDGWQRCIMRGSCHRREHGHRIHSVDKAEACRDPHAPIEMRLAWHASNEHALADEDRPNRPGALDLIWTDVDGTAWRNGLGSSAHACDRTIEAPPLHAISRRRVRMAHTCTSMLRRRRVTD